MDLCKLLDDFAQEVTVNKKGMPEVVHDQFDSNAIVHAVDCVEIGSKGMVHHLSNYFSGLPDLFISFAKYTQLGEDVLFDFVCEATHTENFLGIEPTYKRIQFNPLVIYSFDDQQKVKKYSFCLDLLDVFHQMDVRLLTSGTLKIPEKPNIASAVMESLKKFGTDKKILNKDEVMSLSLAMNRKALTKTQKAFLERAMYSLKCQTLAQVRELVRFLNLDHLFQELDKNFRFTS